MMMDSKNSSFLGSSGSASGATGAYHSSSEQGRVISPLTEVLADLRRKHVAAAGPQLGNATSVQSMSNSLLVDFSIPLTHEGDVDMIPQQRNSTDNGRASRYRRGLASSSHAENLLCSTPHLRHLSAASAYMQGSSGFTSSKNFLSFLLPRTLHPDGQEEISGSSSMHSSTNFNKKKSASFISDYGTCMARSRANYEVALELAAFVRVLAHEMSLEEFAAAESAVFTSIFSMMHSADNSKRLAGVAALDALIGVPSSDEEKKAIKFANNLSNGLRANNVDYEFLAAVSKALGKMAMGASNVDYVEFEVTRALEWLRIERSDRRLAATLTLKELAQNAPTAFYSKTNQNFVNGGTNEFIDHIFPVLRDAQPIVRVCAADAISEFLKIVVDRKHRSTTGLLCHIYANTMDGFNTQRTKRKNGESTNTSTAVQAKIEAAQHASLLIISDLLDHTRDFMLPRFDEICKAVLSLLDHPKSLIRLQIVRLIPRLARRCPGVFGRRYLEKGLKFILESATVAPTPRIGIDIRPAAFYSLGQLALSMSELQNGKDARVPQSTLEIVRNEVDHNTVTQNGSSTPFWTFRAKVGDIYANLDAIFSLVQSGLRKTRVNSSSRGSFVGADTRGAALHCGADLVEALGADAESYVEKLLDDMFESGLSEDLIHCLHSISECLPSQKPFIEERLLQELSFSLAGTKSATEIWDPLDTWTNRLSQLSLDQQHVQSNPSSSNYTRDHKAVHQRIEINMSERPEITVKLVLSLRTLGLFGNLKGPSAFCKILLPFVKDVVGQYLSHPSDEVRREAAITCCLILLPSEDNFNGMPDTTQNGDTSTNGRSSQTFKSPLVSHGIFRRHPGSTSGVLVEEVLQTLLRVAVSDRSPTVRHCVVRSLDLRYDTYMCQAHHLSHLFLILQDEALAVRAAALRLLGNLARINPALILPGLRKFLIDLIIELRCGGDTGGGREAATRLLVVFLKAEALHRLVHPFLPSIIEALPLKGVAPRLASAAMEALGELAQVSRSSLNPWVSQLLPHILETMQDQSSASKQRTSIRTLGLIAGGTGYVISPYIDYPNLLSQAADVLPGTKRAPWALRREVIRTFGILGALDPDRYHAVAVNNRKGGGVGSGYFIELDDEKDLNTVMRRTGATSFPMNNSMSKDVMPSSSIHAGAYASLAKNAPFQEHMIFNTRISRNNDDEDEPAHLYMYELYAMTAQPLSKLPPARRLTPADDEFFPTVAVQALTRILKDPSLAVHHGMVMQAVMFIFNSLGLRCVPFLKGIVPYILQTVRTCGQSSLREALLQQVASLSGIVRDHLRPYVPAIFEIVEEFWSSKHFATVLVLVDKMAVGVPEDFRRYFPRLLPKLLSSIETVQVSDWANSSRRNGNNSSTSKFERLELVIKNICVLRNNLGEYMHLLIPSLLKLTDSLINPALSSDTSGLSRSSSSLAVLSIQTVSILLQAKENELLGQGTMKNGSSCYSTLTSNHSLPARAAQPLIRMLGKGSNSGKVAGYAIIDVLCVCAKQLGSSKWMPLYHLATQDAIIAWQERVGISSISDATVPPDSNQENNHSLTGLQKYDEALRKILFSKNIDEHLDGSPINDHGMGGKPEIDINWTDTESGLNGNAYDGTVNKLGNELQNIQPSIQPISNQKNKHQVNQANLQRAWDVTQRTTREDWDEWMRRFAVQLLREAPAPALRATAALAHAYQPLARELFSAAFVCCWSDLSEKYRENLLHSLETAFFGDVSPEILQTLLNLAEFMEHDGVEGGLPIDISILAELALKCRSYAKALHYKEREHILGGGGACTEYLISINKKLDLPEAAIGVLKAAQFELVRHGLQSWGQPQYHTYGREFQEGFPSRMVHYYQSVDMAYNVISTADEISAQGGGSWTGAEMQESWLAKLGSWSEALAMYERKLAGDPNSVEAIIGCMRCLDARGEWKRVLDLAKSSWEALSSETRLSYSDEKTESQFSPTGRPTSISVSQSQQTPQNYKKALKFCAKAAWRLGDWDDLELYASTLIQGKHEQFGFSNTSNNSGSMNGLPRVDYHGAFYSAILHIHRNEWSKAAGAIDATRRAMDSRFTALMAESYKRAYPSMVTAQTLSEMEEIIEYRKLECRAKAGAHEHPVNRADETEARRRLLGIWRKRLGGCRVDAEVHSDILAVRSLVLGPTDEVESTLTLSALSRQAQCFKLAERVLLDPLVELGADLNGVLFGFDIPPTLKLGLLTSNDTMNNGGYSALSLDRLVTGDPSMFLPKYSTVHAHFSKKLVQNAGGFERLNIQHRLYFAYLKHLWAMDHHAEAMDRLSNLCNVVDMVSHCEKMENTDLRVACWLRLGDWNVNEYNSPGTPIPESLQTKVLMAYKRSTASPDCGYKAWHAWALINFRLAQQIHDNRSASIRNEMNKFSRSRVFLLNSSTNLKNHVVAAVQGFVKAISIGTKRWSASVQQDMLNFLTCLFKYAELPEVAATISAEIGVITLEAWLGVLPQLLARIHIKSTSVRSILHPLLTRIGAKHPQALMYPLSVLLKSPVTERKVAAESLMNSLKAHSNELVEEALMVSSELIRVAILWLELWHEGLEDASRLYFGEGNVSGMLEVLIPLHDQLEIGPSTKREMDFHMNFGNDLGRARECIKNYIDLTTSNGGEIPTQGGFMPGTPGQDDQSGLPSVTQNAEAEAALNQAWDLYYIVFRRINKQLPGLTSLELNQCSPALLNAHNLELGVPGSYRVDGSYVKIERFIPSVQVITSKQRPRKIVLRGSNGKDYVFLLKGHEDLRQDERVMQLFGLVNALLARDRRTNNHDLDIQRYAIAPLSHNAGLVGWVPHCDTIHSLIRDYRESKRIPLNMEHREMIKLSPDYEHLTSMQKIEIFSEALERTTGKGNDLYEVLWIKSMNSEEWLERRTKFTRSLAVMSMVGYILGLGDRHPSNLMLDQISGRILHIDFGDCFEVAMHREKFPEKIPFRLTRMLIKAMEVSGIEGSYRTTCERTMSVLRDNRDSLVAMLEAFVDDPLISWRLLNQTSDRSGNDDPQPTSNHVNENGNSFSRQQQEVVGASKNDNVYNNGTNNNNVDVETTGRSYAQGIANESIRESSFEDSLDGGDNDGNHNRLYNKTQETKINLREKKQEQQKDAMGAQRQEQQKDARARSLQMYNNMQSWAANLNTSPRIASLGGGTEAIAVRQELQADAIGAQRQDQQADATGAQRQEQQVDARARSLQMYNNMQTMVANLNTGSRIASLTAGGTEAIAAEGSLARSRLDRSLMQREAMSMFGGENIGEANEEALNTKALKVIRRVQDKLTGTDFQDSDNDGNITPLDVQDQVQRLIVEATSTENLCQLFIGWCAFW